MAMNTVEQEDGTEYVPCPNCSRLHPSRGPFQGLDRGSPIPGAPIEVPNRCRRCGSPMDERGAHAFADDQASREHDPALASTGNRMRGLVIPQEHRMVTEETPGVRSRNKG